MKITKRASLLLAMLLTVMCCLCACSESGVVTSQNETTAAQNGGNASGYSSSAGVDMSGTGSSADGGNASGYSSSAGVDMSGTNGDNSTGVYGEVRFKNTLNWSTPYIYYWSDTNNKMTSWPGSPMQLSTDNTYTFTLPTGVGYIIFNNGADVQTVDIRYDGSVAAYQLSSDTDADGKYYAATMSGDRIDSATKYDTTQTVNDAGLGISVEKAAVVDEYYTESFATNGGNDAVVFTIKNNTTDVVKELTIYVIFADASGNTVKPFGSYNTTNDINVLTTNDVIIQPGETKEIPYRCDADTFKSFDSVVANYLVGRTMYINTDADTWAGQYIK